MIAFLSGEVHSVSEDGLILNVQGVGYEVTCTPQVLNAAVSGAALSLDIYTQVRDDAIQLYGFFNRAEKSLFLSLIKVNGIGPKSALQIVSAAPIARITELINEGNAKGLSELPKIGKKTAEQIVLTLKGKLVSADPVTANSAAKNIRGEIVSALVHLGFRLADVEKVVERMPHNIDLENGVRQGLGALTS